MSKKPFTLFIIQHSHIDIGYTERQEVITEYQRQFINQAVSMALSPAQQTRDENSRFKFMCEGFWAVEQYLTKCGEEGKKRLVEAIKNGSLELSASYLHMSELLDEGHMHDQFKPALEFSREAGVPIHSAMSVDVTGFSWGMADALYDAGIQYLSTNINTHHASIPFGKPNVPFYWESPKGNRVLVWSGLTYHKGGLLGLIPGYNYIGNPMIPGFEYTGDQRYEDVQDISYAEQTLFKLIESLRQKGYEYNFLPIHAGALYTDNNPVTDAYCDLIKQWNDKHGDEIILRTINNTEFFQYLEQEVSEIPVYRGDWNDWWTDGTISTPFETALFRNGQRMKRIAERLDPEGKYVSAEEWKPVTHALILYAEHTWGHSNSLRKASDFRVQQLLARKIKYAIQADELACSALDQVLYGKGQSEFSARRSFTYKVINPSLQEKSSIAYLSLDYWEDPIFRNRLRVVDDEGREYEFERVRHSLRGQELAVILELGPLEERRLLIIQEKLEEPAVTPPTLPTTPGIFENAYIQVAWCEKKGIHRIIHKPTGVSLLNDGAEGFASPVYQIFEGANRAASGGFGYSKRTIPNAQIFHGELKAVTNTANTLHYEIWEFEYQVRGAHSYVAEFKFYRELSRFDVSVKVNKENILDPEGMYVAFPFHSEGGWHLDKAGAVVRPGLDRLPGTCVDYFTVQAGAALTCEQVGVALSILDAPLVHIGRIRLWEYANYIEPTGTLYSWLTNNKWETNFKASCGGLYEFRYTFDIDSNYRDPETAIRACQENQFDFIAIRT